MSFEGIICLFYFVHSELEWKVTCLEYFKVKCKHIIYRLKLLNVSCTSFLHILSLQFLFLSLYYYYYYYYYYGTPIVFCPLSD